MGANKCPVRFKLARARFIGLPRVGAASGQWRRRRRRRCASRPGEHKSGSIRACHDFASANLATERAELTSIQWHQSSCCARVCVPSVGRRGHDNKRTIIIIFDLRRRRSLMAARIGGRTSIARSPRAAARIQLWSPPVCCATVAASATATAARH